MALLPPIQTDQPQASLLLPGYSITNGRKRIILRLHQGTLQRITKTIIPDHTIRYLLTPLHKTMLEATLLRRISIAIPLITTIAQLPLIRVQEVGHHTRVRTRDIMVLITLHLTPPLGHWAQQGVLVITLPQRTTTTLPRLGRDESNTKAAKAAMDIITHIPQKAGPSWNKGTSQEAVVTVTIQMKRIKDLQSSREAAPTATIQMKRSAGL